MNKPKFIVVRNADDLAQALGLPPEDAVEMQIRRKITDKIITAFSKSGLTQAQAAKSAGTSRSRLTAILNRNTGQVSTDLLLRILLSLGFRAHISFTRSQNAA